MKRLIAWSAMIVVLSACAQPAGVPVARVTASPSQPASSPRQSPAEPSPAIPSPAIPSPTTLPFADLPLAKVSFSCRLPIYRQDAKLGTVEDSFVSFPGGEVTPDPNGNNGMYFDRAYSRWVPVRREAVSPDGAHYATAEIGAQPGVFLIHIVDVATGSDNTIQLAATNDFGSAQPIVFDYEPEVIYLVQAFEHVWPGVWLFDPATKTIRKAADVETPELIGPNEVLWFGQVNIADPSPFTTRSSAGIFPDEVGRLDLKSGSRQQWDYEPGIALEVIGVDLSGNPLVQVLTPGPDPGIGSTGFFNHSQSELLIGLSSTSRRSIFKGGLVETLRSPIADSHGVWFGSDQGIYLYSEAGGL